MNDDIIDTIAAELRDWWGYRRDREIEVSTGILTALRERYTIVKLPTGETVPCGDLGHCVQFDAPNDIGGVSGMNGTVSDSESEWTPDEARTLAAALLAAAAAAEADQ